MKITVVLTAFVQTSYEDYTHQFKNVIIEIPDDGNQWHVCGEMSPINYTPVNSDTSKNLP